ncbi:DUF721 domain-containing protein [Kribbia dieselivorans]|uniref:DUF721 domain-containing protein n=1 Tax=Kribbia dieselivorans TaxID=331526 RepID=UPI000AE70256|nr:DciA family protein [Kribbia dieselivorans]
MTDDTRHDTPDDMSPETSADDTPTDETRADEGSGDDGSRDDTALRDAARLEDAAQAALSRARAAARAKGLRPGLKPLRRRVRNRATPTTPMDGTRDPHLLGDQLDRLVSDRGWKVDVAVGSVMGRWPEIVGPDVAAHCQPVTFEAGVLTVRAESTSWATQIRLLASSILARLETEIGPGAVTELRVKGPNAPSWSRGPRRISDGRGPRDTYG